MDKIYSWSEFMRRREFIRNTAVGLGVLAAGWYGRAKAKGSKYRAAVIGRTGKGNYGHGLDVVWNDIEQVEVVAVTDEDEKGRAGAAKRLKVTKAYSDYREMLEKERPQIVSVAPLWLDCHRDMVLACAEHGCHIFLEKPMCQSLEQADEMIASLEKRNLKLAIAHQTRYSPALEHVRKIIAEGKLGDILELRGRGKEDRRGGGEGLMVLGTHIMDLMRFFCGDPQ
jgi:predicted dehydrogenase